MTVAHGLRASIDDLSAQSPAFRERAQRFVGGLVSHYLLDGGRLAVAHAGIKAEMMGRASGTIRGFCLFGETTGESDAFGLPVRLDWAAEYRGEARVVFGHPPWSSRPSSTTRSASTPACVFGGRLTALRYPELEIVAVPAARVYSAPVRPLGGPPAPEARPAQAEARGLLGADLAGLPHPERAAVLCGIRGVGPWTADMVGIFHFLDPDIWPAGDVAAVGTLRKLTGRDDTAAVAARFAPDRSILARYLWRCRDAVPAAEAAA